MKKKEIRPIAFVLPQFHPIPENDLWWGKGFTEWTNVAKAKPLFEGHYQPHLPTELGFYDLRLPEARMAQAELAKNYGIYGFCYYHYWFNGKRLLEYPVDEIVRLGEPDMPFMLCWANENWTRRWDGKDSEILIKQEYSVEDDKAHIRWLCENRFSDKRYIRVDDCPVFIIYRHDLFPNIKKTLDIWRDIAKSEYNYRGLYICVTESFNSRTNPLDINSDAVVEFSPHQVIRHKILKRNKNSFLNSFTKRVEPQYSLRDFQAGVRESIVRKLPSYKLYRSVTPSWDNTARKNDTGVVGVGSNPELYYEWLTQLIKKTQPFSKDENFLFINAMNEWAEGNHLEPCRKWGKAYLEATKRAFDEA